MVTPREVPSGVIRGLVLLLFALGVFFGVAAGVVRATTGWSEWLTQCLLGSAVCLGSGGVLRLLMNRVEQGEAQGRLLERLCRTVAAPSVPQPAASWSVASVPMLEEKPIDPSRTQMLEILQQIRDAAMMSDSQRAQCAVAHWNRRKETISKLVERHMLSGDWAMAKWRVEELRTLLPEDEDLRFLSGRVMSAHAVRMTEELTAARAQLKQLVSVQAWAEADEILACLQMKYPQETQVLQLAGDIAHDREKFERQHRERLLSQLGDATEKRQWRRAIESAEEFIQRFPEDTVTERLRFDLTMLGDNASAAERKEQEGLFKDLLRRQRYDEAQRVANALIEKYPGSPAAAELTKMLPRVEELIRQEKMKRQGVGAG